jgi:hypothetical protein
MAPLYRLGVGDAQLRFRIGSAVLAQLEGVEHYSAAERKLLDRAVLNARLLIGLESTRPRSFHLLGSTRRLQARETPSAEALAIAVWAFEKALVLDPEFAGAELALHEASQDLAEFEAH